MAADGLAVVVVNCDDGVPRLSRVSTLRLAIELRESADKNGTAEKWKAEDQASVKRSIHVNTLSLSLLIVYVSISWLPRVSLQVR
jgi:hypothetical protein